MKGKRNLKLGHVAGAFALGATAGSAAALLLAPASGKITRKRIASQFRTMGRSANRGILQGKKMLTKKAVLLKDSAVERLGETREWLMERLPVNGNGKHHALPRRAARR